MNVEQALLMLQESMWTMPTNQNSVLKKQQTFITDMANKVRSNKKFSTGQAAYILRLISNYSMIIADKKKIDIEEIKNLVNNPIYANEPYESVNIPKEVRYVGNDFIVFKFKFDPILKENIKDLKPGLPMEIPYPEYNSNHKIWIVKISSKNVDKTIEIIGRYGFQYEEDLAQYFTDILNRKNDNSSVNIQDDKIVIDIPNDDIFSDYVESFLVTSEKYHA
jgi:hypothetical protein